MQNIITKFFQNNFLKLPKAIAIAVSGGIDSLALTFLLHEFCLKNNVKLLAITIDHKMRQGSSQEALQLHKLLQKNKIIHQVLTLETKKVPKKNVEANLREARYEMLYEHCSKNKIEHLFLGHHLGDVAENFLIRLFRGSQLDGLSVMQEISQYKQIKLCRPLLDVKKDDLKNFLQDKKIKWFEDESNDDEKFLRNKIRKFFDQFEDKNLIQKRIKSASEVIKESRDFVDDILLRDAANCLVFEPEGKFLINVEEYKKIPPQIALKILSLVLIEVSGNVYKPRLEGLKNFEKNILALKKGQKKNFYGCMAKLVNKGSNANIIMVYPENPVNEANVQKFSTSSILIDNRFVAKINKNKNPAKTYKFYFRTILERVFS